LKNRATSIKDSVGVTCPTDTGAKQTSAALSAVSRKVLTT
jgi:hypothetical protein